MTLIFYIHKIIWQTYNSLKLLCKAWKPVFYFVPLLFLSSCIDDNFNEEDPSSKDKDGTFFLTLDISPNTVINSRAVTGEGDDSHYYDEDGTNKETGQSWENEINEVIIILATTSDGGKTPDKFITYFTAKTSDRTLFSNDNIKYRASITLSRTEVDALASSAGVSTTGSFNASIYAVCNPSEEIKNKISSMTKDSDVQSTVSISSSVSINTYGGYYYTDSTNGEAINFKNFLMTNGDYLNPNEDKNKDKYTKEISLPDIYAATSPDVAYKLNPKGGSIPVQRALARFDINTSIAVEFFDENSNYLSELQGRNPSSDEDWSTQISMEYIGLGNISKNFNLFKETGNPLSTGLKGTKGTDWGFFWSEVNKTENSTGYDYRFVFDPEYSNKKDLLSAQTYDRLKDYFENYVFDRDWFYDEDSYDNDDGVETSAQRHKANRPFQKIDRLNNNKFGNSWTNTSHDETYKVWKYCIPNTIHEAEMQKNGISTCVIFVARMNFKGGYSGTFGTFQENATPIYFWKGKNYWTNRHLQELKARVENNDPNVTEGDKEMVAAYKKAILSATDSDNTWLNSAKKDWNTESDLEINECYNAMNTLPSESLSKALVANGFSIYVPLDMQGDGKKEYMCFYYFWNKHNENYQEGVMGPMEFGVVRNNIYQLSVNGILRIGHPLPVPGIETDPDPITPDTDDEVTEQDQYLSIDLNVLSWAKRDIPVIW